MACEYIPSAKEDEGPGYLDLFANDCEGNCLRDTNGDIVCDELEVEGCTDADACNYDDEATEDDGSCT